MSIQYKIASAVTSAIPSCKQKNIGLMFSIDQWFSTAGPRTGAGPRSLSAGPKQSIPILYFKEALPVPK